MVSSISDFVQIWRVLSGIEHVGFKNMKELKRIKQSFFETYSRHPQFVGIGIGQDKIYVYVKTHGQGFPTTFEGLHVEIVPVGYIKII